MVIKLKGVKMKGKLIPRNIKSILIIYSILSLFHIYAIKYFIQDNEVTGILVYIAFYLIFVNILFYNIFWRYIDFKKDIFKVVSGLSRKKINYENVSAIWIEYHESKFLFKKNPISKAKEKKATVVFIAYKGMKSPIPIISDKYSIERFKEFINYLVKINSDLLVSYDIGNMINKDPI